MCIVPADHGKSARRTTSDFGLVADRGFGQVLDASGCHSGVGLIYAGYLHRGRLGQRGLPRDMPSSTVPLPSEVVPQWRHQVMFAVMKEPGLFVAAQPAGGAAA